MVGMVLTGIGLAVMLAFAAVAVQNVAPGSEFRQAQAGRAAATGSAIDDLRLFIVTTRVEFLVAGAVAGGLLALNGVTLMMIGRLAAQTGEGRR